ncbi:MAG: hypothetical protein A2268_01225 [Candidatus Raymondbacteria bacterium RifOxyA12_full_50_37]|uniref:Uncharacterized protein n=1 Tax=Candidatus Raymondbacteria bacterium RIFOXYD12_FULL_49_13 TaxID=1817890 RepID=A0A1F7FD58_UNCRA|nr:MAG: hypothetical protein A2268_01225 [Candidatus Raymondbacteria bacterium RifOxyA12_full_50_37]OGJ86424.1 MAG: hypothetical protein A2248_14190 [Candidatus Raymondbacteria bacterium RIFOXYA2_FULL_49_16]OGK04452.1 MAG: hypothetical protein A2519_11365 [Candidatus Raymondbacteria bacterium RIFOXYD12_FULL_49_13]OGP40005.1 MAG: hypothetical protein A2324_11235 [Candidatus Raymondbacteria bacterium RIFOXYB2_FULL_49_35]
MQFGLLIDIQKLVALLGMKFLILNMFLTVKLTLVKLCIQISIAMKRMMLALRFLIIHSMVGFVKIHSEKFIIDILFQIQK